MVESAQPGLASTFLPFGAAPSAGVSPQGFDFGQFAQQLAGLAAQALPGLILSLLSAHPTIGPQMRAQGVSPQSLINLGLQTPFGGGGVSLFGAAPSAGVSPQGFDFGQFVQQLAGQAAQALPGLILSLLSANPTIGPQMRAQAAPSAGVSPQGFDFGQFAQQLAGQAAQALPGLILSLLSANPTIGPQMRAQGVSPQSLINLGLQTPFGGGGVSLLGAAPSAGVSPQGFDFGQFAQQLAGLAAQALPGLILSLLSAHPTIGPQMRAQGVSPQSLINLGLQTPFGGGGVSLFGAAPSAGVSPQGFDFGQFAQQLAGQAAQVLPGLILSLLSANPTIGPQMRAQAAPSAGVSPQGFDFGQFAQQLAGQAAQALPGLILSLLSAHPTIGPQMRVQGVSPQSLINLGVQTPFGGGGVSLFGAAPSAGVSPQGFDFGQFAQQLAGQAAQALPGLILGILSAHPTTQQSSTGSATIH